MLLFVVAFEQVVPMRIMMASNPWLGFPAAGAILILSVPFRLMNGAKDDVNACLGTACIVTVLFLNRNVLKIPRSIFTSMRQASDSNTTINNLRIEGKISRRSVQSIGSILDTTCLPMMLLNNAANEMMMSWQLR